MRGQRGFYFVEVMIAAVVLATVAVPALDALRTGVQSGVIPSQRMSNRYLLGAKMEEVLSQNIGDLDTAATAAGSATTATTYSDAAGSANRRLVYLSRYDADNADNDNNGFTGVDAGLVWVRVEMENTGLAFESLVRDH